MCWPKIGLVCPMNSSFENKLDLKKLSKEHRPSKLLTQMIYKTSQNKFWQITRFSKWSFLSFYSIWFTCNKDLRTCYCQQYWLTNFMTVLWQTVKHLITAIKNWSTTCQCTWCFWSWIMCCISVVLTAIVCSDVR